MANNRMLVGEKTKSIGTFTVGRLLPFREKRQVGPFTFIDHMGPVVLNGGQYFDVDQHPHIGLSTLTYLLEGQIEHKDSTGAVRVIHPGDVGFMTSGKGVSHTERTPAELRESGTEIRMHGYQVWVAMPKEKEDQNPRFDFVHSSELPQKSIEEVSVKLIAGKGFGMESPLPVHSELFMVDMVSDNASESLIDLRKDLVGEIAIVVTKGRAWVDGDDDKRVDIDSGNMLVSEIENECKIGLLPGTRLLLFGGEPFPEKRYMYWNFVSSRREKIEQAKAEWEKKLFPKVPGDETYIPLP
ncbi:MAG: pirin family protein [Candidatus Kapaibacteriales bacterium]